MNIYVCVNNATVFAKISAVREGSYWDTLGHTLWYSMATPGSVLRVT